MAENESNKVIKPHPIRSNFALLLYLSVVIVSFIPWAIFVTILTVVDEMFFYDWESIWFDLNTAIFIPLFIFAHTSIIAIGLSNILRKKWWIAILGTVIFFGTPLIGFIYTWLGKQIARLMYLATPSDLQRTKVILNMTVKPRKGIIYADSFQSTEINVQSEFEEEIKNQTIASILSNTKNRMIKVKPEKPSFFSLWQCSIGALFGGFLGGGMLLALNYKQLSERRFYIIGVITSLVGQFVLLMLMIGLSYADTSSVSWIPIILGIVISIYFWHRELQQEDIKNEIAAHKAKKRSWWGVVAFVVLSWVFLGLFHGLAEEIIWSLNMPFQ